MLSVQEAAGVLSVSFATVRNWIKTGLIGAQKTGRATSLSKAEVLGLREKIVRGKKTMMGKRSV